MPIATATETVSPAKRKPRAAKAAGPSPEQIQQRAYEIYLERRGAPGNEFEDWTRAERELREQAQTKTPKAPRASKSKAKTA